jgi:ketosteroid isomerase-like protein
VPTAAPAAVDALREAAKLPPPAPIEPRREGSDADRIRDTIRRYVEAQNALDVDRYAKVFPSVNRARVQAAFESYRSQTLEVEIQKIDIAPGGNRATVRGHERRLIVPRIGSEQRDSRTSTIQLEKRGDGWVIVGLS